MRWRRTSCQVGAARSRFDTCVALCVWLLSAGERWSKGSGLAAAQVAGVGLEGSSRQALRRQLSTGLIMLKAASCSAHVRLGAALAAAAAAAGLAHRLARWLPCRSQPKAGNQDCQCLADTPVRQRLHNCVDVTQRGEVGAGLLRTNGLGRLRRGRLGTNQHLTADRPSERTASCAHWAARLPAKSSPLTSRLHGCDP